MVDDKPRNAPNSIIAVIRPFLKPAPDAFAETSGNWSRNCGMTRVMEMTPWLQL